MKTIHVVLVLIISVSLPLASMAAGANWVAKRIYDPFRNETRCVAESPPQRIHDGYQDTEVTLRVDQRSLLVITKSNIDTNHPDVGIRVDEQALLKPDRVYLDQMALYEKQIDEIVRQFKDGLRADVHLRFWPTWAPKGLKTATFSLIGFRKAFAKLPDC